MKKKLLVLTMSTLFATQIMNSNHAKASVTDKCRQKIQFHNQVLIKGPFHFTMNLIVHQSKC